MYGSSEALRFERVSKKKFVLPLIDGDHGRSAAILVPLIKRYIRPGSIIVSDGWAAYNSLKDEGYVHWVVNHSVEFVSTEDSRVHTQNIERLWRDLKEWSKRPGNRRDYFRQYLARYLFCQQDDRQHQFLLSAASLYPFTSSSKASGKPNTVGVHRHPPDDLETETDFTVTDDE